MRKLVLGLLGAAAALTVSTPSYAASFDYNGIDSTLLNQFLTEQFGETRAGEDPMVDFVQTFTFTLDADYLANSQLSGILLQGLDIDFTSITLDGFAFTQTGFDPSTETWELIPPQNVLAGSHTITVTGRAPTGAGSYGGNINLTAVPEPGTWAMMLVGFGAVGFAMRRRRTPVLAQVA